jgi:hypothetical protein
MVSSTVEADTNTTNPCWKVDSIEIGKGRERREVDGKRKSKEVYFQLHLYELVLYV